MAAISSGRACSRILPSVRWGLKGLSGKKPRGLSSRSMARSNACRGSRPPSRPTHTTRGRRKLGNTPRSLTWSSVRFAPEHALARASLMASICVVGTSPRNWRVRCIPSGCTHLTARSALPSAVRRLSCAWESRSRNSCGSSTAMKVRIGVVVFDTSLSSRITYHASAKISDPRYARYQSVCGS